MAPENDIYTHTERDRQKLANEKREKWKGWGRKKRRKQES